MTLHNTLLCSHIVAHAAIVTFRSHAEVTMLFQDNKEHHSPEQRDVKPEICLLITPQQNIDTKSAFF